MRLQPHLLKPQSPSPPRLTTASRLAKTQKQAHVPESSMDDIKLHKCELYFGSVKDIGAMTGLESVPGQSFRWCDARS